MRVFVGKSPIGEGSIYNGQMEERAETREGHWGQPFIDNAPQNGPEW